MKPENQILLNEKDALRNELVHLKNCQLRYFTLSVTTTGVLLGLGSRFGITDSSALFYFAPLLIILPCWWIFFDKATTITRGVGYLRVLEFIVNSPAEKLENYTHQGWENALASSRNRQRAMHSRTHSYANNSNHFKILWIAMSKALAFRSSHLYWTLNWYTFFGLSLICWILGTGILNNSSDISNLLSFKVAFPTMIIIFSSIYNLYLLGDLTDGKRSYESTYRTWKNLILDEKM